MKILTNMSLRTNTIAGLVSCLKNEKGFMLGAAQMYCEDPDNHVSTYNIRVSFLSHYLLASLACYLEVKICLAAFEL